MRVCAMQGVSVVQTTPHRDHRGAFSRLFCARELAGPVGDRTIVQINHSRTSSVGAIRGLHFQRRPAAEMKFVRCLRGRVWDVVVDLRDGSPTRLDWFAVELAPDQSNMIVIPEGCAHGFQVLETDSELLYLHTAYYTPEAEGGVRYDDPALAITWPLEVTDISRKDCSYPALTDEFRRLDAAASE
jgi:dTDP-4-dehydrorhamnose 3,5-epimerase